MTRSVHTRMRALRMTAAILATPLALSPVLTPPAAAQWIVYDPTNYAQNVLTAARTLQQVNQQITQLQQALETEYLIRCIWTDLLCPRYDRRISADPADHTL